MDTGATHNFMKYAEAVRLGLKVKKGIGYLKTVNATIKPLDGVIRGVKMSLGK